MKAIVYRKYGSTKELHQEEIEKPAIKDDEVLVKVHAASVNSWDWDLVIGRPLIYRLLFGLFKPRYPIIGSDVAGMVEEVGKQVTHFKPGDEVLGDISGSGFGAFAKYASAKEYELAHKPPSMSFEEAAAFPQAGVLALQGLRHATIESGTEVLINGAGGGVGSFAIQLAKLWGAKVTAVDRGDKLEFMRALGADHVIDYSQENFTKMGRKYDLILDVTAHESFSAFKKALNPKGVLAVVGGTPARMIEISLLGKWLSGSRTMGMVMHKPNRADLDYLSQLVTENKLRPIIDKTFPLNETAQAVQYLGEARMKGKVVVKI